MLKVLSALALITATVLPIDSAQAASGWRSYIVQRACVYLRSGYTAYDSGYNAAKDTINSRYGTSFMRDYGSTSETQMSQMLQYGILSTCPDAL